MLLAFGGPGKKPRTSLQKQATLSNLLPQLHLSSGSGNQEQSQQPFAFHFAILDLAAHASANSDPSPDGCM